MKDRILQIMKQEGMTQQEFAQALNVSPSSLSSIFNGRTNPTSNHVQAIHRRFPTIRINWLMFGEGDMYESSSPTPAGGSPEASADGSLPFDTAGGSLFQNEGGAIPGSLFEAEEENGRTRAEGPQGEKALAGASPIIRETIKYIDKPQRKITEIRIFFDDGTYETYSGQR